MAEEQAYVDELFRRLDGEITQARARLAEVQAAVDTATPDAEALLKREVEYHGLNDKLDRLTIAQLGLVFGQITIAAGEHGGVGVPVDGHPEWERRYIGRMGIDDRADNYRTLLLDWRAPAARPFYVATTAQPEGVVARRHIRTRRRTVVGVDDEFLSADAPGAAALSDAAPSVVSEQALYRVLERARTAHMPTIVETIQREQDAIIRDATRKVMVVEGGPGTGKTAVALHRVAYLLYTWREQLEKTGVLIIGPNRDFLSYISRVLPELGETGVVLSTCGELYPGLVPVTAGADGTSVPAESVAAQEIKGSEEMVYILKNLVRSYQRTGATSVLLDRTEVEITTKMVTAARTRARRSRLPHNRARAVFRDALLESVARAYAEILFSDPLGPTVVPEAEVAQLHDEIAEVEAVEEFINSCWPRLEPLEVLAEFLSSEEMIAAVAGEYDEYTQRALYRADGAAWQASDAALADELAELIGVEDEQQLRAAQEAAWREELEDAQIALDILESSQTQDLDDGFDAEILQASDVVDAATLARRQEVGDHRTTAQRAAADERWAYGHVIIDEAQELTPMEWRMVMRRCPSRWMTLVGDTAQTGAPAGVDSWAQALQPFVKGRFVHHELTINYRTPEEIMAVAAELLPVVAPEQTPATSLRRGGEGTVSTIDASGAAVADRVVELLGADRERRIAVLLPQPGGLLPEGVDDEDDPEVVAARAIQRRAVARAAEVAEALAARGVDPQGPAAAGRVVVAPTSQVKGLEFDHVIVVDPELMVEASPQGWQDLYVALTRATQTATLAGGMVTPQLVG
ncbi:AAA family ATPase [Corynebacterium sp. 13CS0277]|uniref:HelD family protein n=1 Tax=Corynebacterium sp. 13CS0277 TaxID=2071994 RepID=UPI001E591EC9|nr:AAA family ATPase [Corynebacterium sp. 13CS0277]